MTQQSVNPRDPAAPEITAMAEALIQRGFPWMRFPKMLEQHFVNSGAARRLRYFVITGLLSLLVFDAFLVADYLAVPDVFAFSAYLRLVWFTPTALVFILLGLLASGWVLRHIPPVAVETIVLVSGLAAAASLAVIQHQSRSPLSQYYHVGFLVVLMYGTVVQRLRFWFAVGYSLCILVMHLAGIWLTPVFNERLMWPIMLLTLGTVAFTLLSNYVLERDQREMFLLSLRRKRLLSDLGAVHLQLQHLSRTDALTGVNNRRHFEECLQQIWQRARHDGQVVAVIMVDVDHFKAYNDLYGHAAGDKCLEQVAQAMAESLRSPGDVVARIGGEEFVAVLPNTHGQRVEQAAERVRRAVQGLAIPHAGSRTSPVVTASLGVAWVVPAADEAAATVVAAADAALYCAKQQGRNRVATPCGA